MPGLEPALLRFGGDKAQISELIDSTARSSPEVGLVGYLPIDASLVPSGLFSSVKTELTSMASYHGTDCHEIVEALNLDDVLDLRAEALSGGQLVRAAIGIIATARPKAWILDRCFEWLDQDQRETVRRFFEIELAAGIPVTEIACRDRWLLGRRDQARSRVPNYPSCNPTSHPAMIVDRLEALVGSFRLGPISFTVHQGERIALLGPNGSGKTTLARALLGLISIQGRIVHKELSCQKSGSVLAFQNPDHQIFRPTVRIEIEEAAERLGAFDVTRVREVIDILGLGVLLDRDPLSLPFGTRRLVTIAAALVPSLSVAILDEPSAFLDNEQVARVTEAAKKASESGTSIIAISHDPQFVSTFATRVLRMRNGQLSIGEEQK